MKRALFAAVLLVAACGDDGTPLTPPEVTFDQCASDPAAFVRDASLALLGHRPASQQEVDAYVALYDQVAAAAAADQTTDAPRAVVARALVARPEKIARWTAHFMDALRVQRTDDQSQAGCWGEARFEEVDPALAVFVRDNPASANRALPFTMLDLARSAIAADDPTVMYRAHLFPLVSQPLVAANVPDVEAELARREDFGTTFDAAYLNRDIVCLGCHNSESSITDADDPLMDRHWPLAGQVDRAVFGASTGGDAVAAHAMFRVDGFLSNMNGQRRPWGMAAECGRWSDPATVGPDPAGVTGRFGSLTGDRLTVFDLDGALARGFDTLRGTALVVGADGTVADPDAALAYMVATGIVESVWREAVGTPLTIANYFPRNQAARDELQRLTDHFIASRYSLDALLVDVVTSDYFSRRSAAEGCSAGPYSYPTVFDPWVIADTDLARRGNGPGDAVAPLSARTSLSAAYAALAWGAPANEQFPTSEEGCAALSCAELGQFCNFGECCDTFAVQCQGQAPQNDPEELPFQRAIGVFLKSGDRGFRGLDFQARLAWEDRFGTCAKPGRVGGDDFVDRVVAAGAAAPDATVGDVVAVLKDRLLGESTVEPTVEQPALEVLLGQPLSGPATGLTAAPARRLCGVLLSSPQFLLQGMAGRGGAAPLLTLPEDRFDPACARLASTPPAGWTIACAPGKLTATPSPAP